MEQEKRKKKWYTCTPVSFRGDHTFFCRDTGMFSKAFEQAGCESRPIMPLPCHEGDWPEVLRTEYSNLEDADWWKAQQLDGVLLYSWAAPGYMKVARAIHESGTKCLIYLDTGAGFYPFYDWMLSTRVMWYECQGIKHFFQFVTNFLKRNLLSPFFVEPKRKKHVGYGDLILCPLPSLVRSLSKRSWFYGDVLREKVRLLCCPIASHFRYDGEQKDVHVVAIGRWDDIAQKRPDFLRKSLEMFLAGNKQATCTVIGRGHQEMEEWKDRLPEEDKGRVVVVKGMRNEELVELYKKAMVCLCSSAWESTHLVAAEALCCGCSVVAPDNAGLFAHKWYVSEESGTISKEDTPQSLAEALEVEMRHWAENRRDPSRIASIWGKRLHALESVKRILCWDETGIMPDFNDSEP